MKKEKKVKIVDKSILQGKANRLQGIIKNQTEITRRRKHKKNSARSTIGRRKRLAVKKQQQVITDDDSMLRRSDHRPQSTRNSKTDCKEE